MESKCHEYFIQAKFINILKYILYILFIHTHTHTHTHTRLEKEKHQKRDREIRIHKLNEMRRPNLKYKK